MQEWGVARVEKEFNNLKKISEFLLWKSSLILEILKYAIILKPIEYSLRGQDEKEWSFFKK